MSISIKTNIKIYAFILVAFALASCTLNAEQEKQKIQNYSSNMQSQTTRVSVSSEPSGAKIFIDGVSTNQFTPAIVTITASKLVTVTLSKEGYYKYQIAKEFSSASSLSAVLIPTPATGYLNIFVVNGGQNPIITVNGSRVSEKPPISQHAVPANIEIEISATNTFTKLTEKTRIKVAANKIETVQLILGREMTPESPKAVTKTIEVKSISDEAATDMFNLWGRVEYNAEFRKCLDRTDLDYIPKVEVKMFKQNVPAQEKFCYAYLTLQSKQMTYAQFKDWSLSNVQERLSSEKKVYNSTKKLEW